MPISKRVEPDLAMQRACRLLEAIRAAVPVTGITTARMVDTMFHYRRAHAITDAEYRAATKALRDCGAIRYSRGIYTRGEMF